MVGVVVGTMALVIVLSVFNGFDVLIKSFFSVFDPEIKITAAEGKQFDASGDVFQKIKNDKSVIHYCEAVEEIALFRFENRQFIANIKGVSDEYLDMISIQDHMYNGKVLLKDDNFDYAVIGRGLAFNLGASADFAQLYISVPKKGKTVSILNPFNQENILISGIYEVKQQDVDDKYAIIPIDLARNLLEMDNTVTSVELALNKETDEKKFQKQLKKMLGPAYKVETRYQQHESYYKVAKSEKFFIFLTLSFIVIIACFNLASSIAMLMLDKKKDIHILNSLGLTRKKIGSIFMLQGVLVAFIGEAIGLVLGVLVCLGQTHFGWLKFPGSFAIEIYPVELRVASLVIIAITVFVIGIAASWLPVKLLPQKYYQLNEE